MTYTQFPVRVFSIVLPLEDRFTDEWIHSLYPKAGGHHSVAFWIHRDSRSVRWLQLWANEDQVVPYDIKRGLARGTGWAVHDSRHRVGVEASVPFIGSGHRNNHSSREDVTSTFQRYESNGGVFGR